MARPLSNDLRERVVSAIQSGETSRAVCPRERSGVWRCYSRSAIARLVRSRLTAWAGTGRACWSRIAPSSLSGLVRSRR